MSGIWCRDEASRRAATARRTLAIVTALLVTLTLAGCPRPQKRAETAVPPQALPPVRTAGLEVSQVRLPADGAGGLRAWISALLPPSQGEPWTALGGETAVDSGASTPTAWVSDDAESWTRAHIGGGDDGDGWISAAARRDSVTVAVGTVVEGDENGAVWVRRGRTEWHRLRPANVSALGGAGDQRMTHVAGGPLGFVAAGTSTEGGAVRHVLWRSGDGTAWERVRQGEEALEASGIETLGGLAVGPHGVVAVGSQRRDDDDVDGAVWFSTDGRTWEPVPHDEVLFGGEDAQAIAGVAVHEGRFVAVGRSEVELRDEPVVWTSADGRSWHRVPDPPPTSDADITDTIGRPMRAVSSAGEQVVAVGGSRYVPRAWVSPDGESWGELPIPDEVVPPGAELLLTDVAASGETMVAASSEFGLTTIVTKADVFTEWRDVSSRSPAFPPPMPSHEVTGLAHADGIFVAVGISTIPGDGPGKQRYAGVAWHSTDGKAWQRADAPPAVFADAAVNSVATAAGGFVAVGRSSPPPDDPDATRVRDAVAWWSPDGRRWERLRDQSAAFGGEATDIIRDVVATAGGGVAIGTRFDEDHEDVEAWTTRDGRRWRRAADSAALRGPGDQSVNGLCAAGGTVVAVGYDQSTRGQEGAVWLSSDGERWERVRSESFGGHRYQALTDCVATPRGVVAVGAVSVRGGYDAAVWTSPDARSWTFDRAVGLSADSDDTPHVVTAVGDRLVAAGITNLGGEDDLGVWVGAPGSRWTRTEHETFRRRSTQLPSALLVDGSTVYVGGADVGTPVVWVVNLPPP